MKNLILFAVAAVFALSCSPVHAQHSLHIEPPAPADSMSSANHSVAQKPVAARIDLLELQREASELAKTAQSIPLDVENLRKGMLPKDVLQKLKQIEKLSKHLRNQLNP